MRRWRRLRWRSLLLCLGNRSLCRRRRSLRCRCRWCIGSRSCSRTSKLSRVRGERENPLLPARIGWWFHTVQLGSGQRWQCIRHARRCTQDIPIVRGLRFHLSWLGLLLWRNVRVVCWCIVGMVLHHVDRMCGVNGVLGWLLWGFEICDPRGNYFTLPLMLQISQDVLANPKIVELGLNGRNDIVNDLTVHHGHYLIGHCQRCRRYRTLGTPEG